MRQTMRNILVVGAMLTMWGCGSNPAVPEDGLGADGTPLEEDRSALSTRGSSSYEGGDPRALSGSQQAQEDALRQTRILYFDFDSSDLRDQYDAVLDAHARHLVRNPTARIRLEGHTDERGTREYNIGLGERRALAVRRALLLRGATRSQLLVVSFGEERPAALGGTESAWQQNRRVELVYQ